MENKAEKVKICHTNKQKFANGWEKNGNKQAVRSLVTLLEIRSSLTSGM